MSICGGSGIIRGGFQSDVRPFATAFLVNASASRMTAAMSGSLHLNVSGGVARLLIDRPARRNAFDQTMWEAFPALVERAMADAAVRLLIVQAAAPGPFCAGADIAEFGVYSREPAWRAANQAAMRATQVTLTQAPKPTIALVEGDCIGGGCAIALACDMRVATATARFGITPAKLGLVYPLHDTRLLVELVGPAHAKRLLFTAGLIDAAEALRIGLVQLLVDDAATAIETLAQSVVAGSAHTQRASKAIVRRILDGANDDDAALAAEFDAAFDGPDFAEGVAAFLAKRPARFGA